VPADALGSIFFGAVPGHIVQITVLGSGGTPGVSDAVRALWSQRSNEGAGAGAGVVTATEAEGESEQR
jgi:hypothetical protein